ncbi:MAG: DMT family transporter [Anaerolineae bacterium]|nr:DMT family transporter [Anaerolineae bacterium]
MSRERLIAIGQTMLILVLMSLGGVLTKLSLSSISPFTMTWTGLCVGLTAMWIYTFAIKRERIPQMSRQVWGYLIAIGVCNFLIGGFAGILALNTMPVTTNSYLSNFIGFITMGMSIFILREHPYVFQLLGAVVAIAGLRIFFQEIPPVEQLIGIAILLVGITAIAFTNNMARKLSIVTRNELSNNIISTMALTIGGVPLIIAGLIADIPALQTISLQTALIILYRGTIITALGLTVWNHILRTLRSYEASILGATSIIWTAILAVPILGEHLALHQILGMATMLLGIGLVQVRRGKLDFLFGGKPAALAEDTSLSETGQ